MIKCQTCGYDNKDDAQFCLNCGAPLTKQKLSEAVDDVSEDATVMLDPAAMQKRMQEEFQKAQQAKAPAEVPPPAAAPATPPPTAAPAASSPASAPQQQAPAAHAQQQPPQQQPTQQQGTVALSKNQFAMILGVVVFLLVVVLLLLVLR